MVFAVPGLLERTPKLTLSILPEILSTYSASRGKLSSCSYRPLRFHSPYTTRPLLGVARFELLLGRPRVSDGVLAMEVGSESQARDHSELSRGASERQCNIGYIPLHRESHTLEGVAVEVRPRNLITIFSLP